MEDPIKIIYKVKNNNHKNQYHIYIFLGNIVNSNIQKIIKKFKDLNLFETLIELNEKEIKELENKYGIKWYSFFFIHHHIDFMFDSIRKSKQKAEEIIDKFGKDWYNLHIKDYTISGKTTFNFSSKFKIEKINKVNKIFENEESVDYRTNINKQLGGGEGGGGGGGEKGSENVGKVEINNEHEMKDYLNNVYGSFKEIEKKKGWGLWGGISDTESDDESESEDEGNDIIEKINENVDETESVEITEEFSLEELENIFSIEEKLDTIIEDNKESKKTSDMIDKIIEQDKNYEKLEKLNDLISFDNTKDNINYDESLKNVFNKNYVFNNYIYKNDTIKNIKYKISSSIKKNKIFDKDNEILIPSRLYLWSEYYYNELIDNKVMLKYDKVMLGQKWIRRNELLQIDIEPNDNIKVYESLRGNLRTLRDNIKKYGSNIRVENDQYNILDEYSEFYTNNEIYMIDIYNELGKNFTTNPENLKNLFDIYIRIYFLSISSDEFKNIIDYLNNSKKDENELILRTFNNINNDIKSENFITKTIEEIKDKSSKDLTVYKNYLKDNHITQVVTHINLFMTKYNNKTINIDNVQILKKSDIKIDLFRIFDNFIVDEKYPFIQFQQSDGNLVYKFNSNNPEQDKSAILSKWFESAPYGISFKIKVNLKGSSSNKYISVRFMESGRVEYKIQFKEDDEASFDDIKNTYQFVRDLIHKINNENTRLQLYIPNDKDFKFAFINTIQLIKTKGIIDHNQLGDFSRLFYPFIALVIHPRKRLSKETVSSEDEFGKYGTYLRYKRVSNYESERSVEKRILYFLRNFEFDEKKIIKEISNSFNITEKIAEQKIKEIRDKFPYLKKSGRVLRKFENIQRYKAPGIDINILGKSKDNYKLRISGARNRNQLNDICEFISIMLYLYEDWYITKNQDRKVLIEMLKNLNDIAKRRNKVEIISETDDNSQSKIKEITNLDKERLGFKPEKGQNQWTRSCQNSGKIIRRPDVRNSKTINDLLKIGYKLNEKTNTYEKKVNVKENGKNKEVMLKAVKVSTSKGDDDLYYSCDPTVNGKFMYVGFLTRSNNPSGLCMPCCFIKDPFQSNNKAKKLFNQKCLGQGEKDKDGEIKEPADKVVTDKIYILQDTNKLQENRFSFLPKYLDIFFNVINKNTKIIKNNYLTQSDTGYYFKNGIKQLETPYINAIASCLNISSDELKNSLTELLEKDKKMKIFNSINNGDIRSQFNSIDEYINFIKTNNSLDYELLDDLISIKYNLNIFIFVKDEKIIMKDDKKITKDDYILICKGIENSVYYNDRNSIFLIKDENQYFPIFNLKKSVKDVTIIINKTFNSSINVVKTVIDYSLQNCTNLINKDLSTNAKYIYKNNTDSIIGQMIDAKFRCKYLISKNNILLPCSISGSISNLDIFYDDSLSKYINELNKTVLEIHKILKIYPSGIYFNDKLGDKVDEKFKIDGLMYGRDINIPVIDVELSKEEIQKLSKSFGLKQLAVERKSQYDKIDKILHEDLKKDSNKKGILDVNIDSFKNDSYKQFKLELSYFLQQEDALLNKLNDIYYSKKSYDDKKYSIQKLFYKIVNKDLTKVLNKAKNIQLSDDDDGEESDIDSDEYSIEKNKKVLDDSNSENSDTESKSGYESDNMYGGMKRGEMKGGEMKGGGFGLGPNISLTDDHVFAMSKAVKGFENIIQNNIMSGVVDGVKSGLVKYGSYSAFGGMRGGGVGGEKMNGGDLIQATKKLPELSDYLSKNIIETCELNNDEKKCDKNKMCIWKNNECKMGLTKDIIIQNVNKLADEILSNEFKYFELINKDKYSIGDVNDSTNFTIRHNQKIIKSNSVNVDKILSEIYGEENLPILGKKRIKIAKDNVIVNLPQEFNNKILQLINYDDGIYRAFSNSYYWLENKLLDKELRNIGYFSTLQTDITFYVKSLVIDFLRIENKRTALISYFDSLKINIKKDINDYKDRIIKNIPLYDEYIVELYIINDLFKIPIVIYNDFENIISVYDNGVIYNKKYNIGNESAAKKYLENKDYINIKFEFVMKNLISNFIVIFYK
jgi:hypothetical protein